MQHFTVAFIAASLSIKPNDKLRSPHILLFASVCGMIYGFSNFYTTFTAIRAAFFGLLMLFVFLSIFLTFYAVIYSRAVGVAEAYTTLQSQKTLTFLFFK